MPNMRNGGAEEWAPADGAERILYTSTATIAASIGFAFLLIAGMLLAGDTINERTALAWAAAGFVVTGLAPAVGLSPELPGMPAADLFARQGWWVLTAVAHGAVAVAVPAHGQRRSQAGSHPASDRAARSRCAASSLKARRAAFRPSSLRALRQRLSLCMRCCGSRRVLPSACCGLRWRAWACPLRKAGLDRSERTR